MALLLWNHFYCLCPAFPGTDAAPFAIVKVGLKVSFRVLVDAAFGTVNRTNTALYASIFIPNRSLRSPVASLVLGSVSRAGYHTAYVYVLPGEIGFLTFTAQAVLL